MTRRGRPRLSQHFLVNRRAARRIADALHAPAGADVLEIGPGRGALTEHLLGRGWRVTAVELDSGLAAALAARWVDRGDLRVVEADILGFAPGPPTSGAWHVVGNLPYAITTPILFHVLDWSGSTPIAEIVVMVQREVAERLAAEPGSRDYGALTVGVALDARVETLFHLSPGSFRPPPRVRSTVVRVTPVARPDVDPDRRERVRAIVRRAFGQRRKQLQKILRSLWGLEPEEAALVGEKSGLDLERRPETLDLADWLQLEASLTSLGVRASEERERP